MASLYELRKRGDLNMSEAMPECHHARPRTGIGQIAPRASLFALTVLAAITAVDSASAAPVETVLTYTYDAGTSLTFPDGDTADLKGTVTINPPADGLFSDDIVITEGGQETGTYEPAENLDGALAYDSASSTSSLFVFFSPKLDLSPVHPLLTEIE